MRLIREWKRGVVRGVWAAALLVVCGTAWAGERASIPVFEPFKAYVLTDGLDFPWEMLWGPDNRLWVTERHGRRITRVDPDTGEKKVLVTIPEAYPGPSQEGVFGMAFGPGFGESGSDSHLYVYYTVKGKGTERRWGRIVRFEYDAGEETLENPVVIIDMLPAGDDHNGGRLRLGPDGKLYLTIGEQGHNQFSHHCLPIEAQRLPRQAEVEKEDWAAYCGKVLRLELDGRVPSDNPVLQGVRSHVFTLGHRNPQGLAFVGEDLYSCEHGPSSDDEINLLKAGGNYGWPHVAGFRDGMGYKYANYSAAPNCEELDFDPNVIPEGVPTQHEMEWYNVDFVPPVKTFFTVREGHDFSDSKCGEDAAYLCWPTVAPSSIAYYPADGVIPGWRNSLVMTTLKSGALYRMPLSGDGGQLQGDVFKDFRSRNRYRVVAFDPAGKRIFVACDNTGGARDDEGRPASAVRDPGAILVFEYVP